MKYKIDKGIEIPPLKRAPTRATYGTSKEVLKELEVGDSFLVDEADSTSALDKFYNPANRMGIRITARKVDNGVRIWRIG